MCVCDENNRLRGGFAITRGLYGLCRLWEGDGSPTVNQNKPQRTTSDIARTASLLEKGYAQIVGSIRWSRGVRGYLCQSIQHRQPSLQPTGPRFGAQRGEKVANGVSLAGFRTANYPPGSARGRQDRQHLFAWAGEGLVAAGAHAREPPVLVKTNSQVDSGSALGCAATGDGRGRQGIITRATRRIKGRVSKRLNTHMSSKHEQRGRRKDEAESSKEPS